MACLLQSANKNAGSKDMHSLGITNFPIPGEAKFPLNAMFAKPKDRGEEG